MARYDIDPQMPNTFALGFDSRRHSYAPMEFVYSGGTIIPPEPSVPVISNVVPASASRIGPNDVLSFDVTDPDGFRRILLLAEFPNLKISERIHDGTSFGPCYLPANGNTRTAITNGFRYSLLRTGGWPASPSIVPYALDVTGQENE